MKILNLLKIPMIRHLLAGFVIVLLLWGFSIKPLQQQNKELQKQLKNTIERQHLLIEKLSAKDTYSISNTVDAKIKKGGRIQLTPENTMKVVNNDTLKGQRKKWWQFWRKK